MRAVVIRDGAAGVEDVAEPVLEANGLLIEVSAAGVNVADLHQIAGSYPAPPGWPSDIPGMELAGRILGVGSRVSGWRVGERVMALVGGGAHAERAVVPATVAMRVPEGIGEVTAAAFPEAFTTAWDALVAQAGTTAGDRVLVTGAMGGVGTAAVQIATLLGAEVVASVREIPGAAGLSSLAPGVVLVKAGAEEDRGPYDVIVELVGGQPAMDRIADLATNGRIVVIGVGAGSRVSLSLGRLMSVRGRVMASTLRARPDAEKAVLIRRVERALLAGLSTGELTVPIDSVHPLEQAREAYARMAESGKFGKVVLSMSPTP